MSSIKDSAPDPSRHPRTANLEQHLYGTLPETLLEWHSVTVHSLCEPLRAAHRLASSCYLCIHYSHLSAPVRPLQCALRRCFAFVLVRSSLTLSACLLDHFCLTLSYAMSCGEVMKGLYWNRPWLHERRVMLRLELLGRCMVMDDGMVLWHSYGIAMA